MGPVEKEFDPSQYPTEYVPVEREDGIAAVLSHVEEAFAHSPNVVLVIPRGAQAFHSTHDFLALGKVPWGREVRVSIASPDPTIAGLARVLGFHLVEPPRDHPLIAGDPSYSGGEPSELLDGVEKPTAPLNLGAGGEVPDWVISPTVPALASGALTTSTWLGDPDEYRGAWQAFQSSANKQPVRPGMPAPRTRPRQTGRLLPTALPGALSAPEAEQAVGQEEEYSPGPDVVTPSGRIKVRQAQLSGQAYHNARGLRYGGLARPMRWSKVFGVAALLLVLSLVAGSAYAYIYLPEATVAVTPGAMPVDALNVQIPVLTSAGSQPQTISPATGSQDSALEVAPPITASLVTAILSREGTYPATGTRQVPSGKATGSLHFINSNSTLVSVPAGAQFKAANGVTVQTTQAGTVPATIFGQSWGVTDIPIVATVEGPDGNIGANQITGSYKGAQFSNPQALAGGALSTVKVVKQEDVDVAVADLQRQVDADKEAAVKAAVPPGAQLITQTTSLSTASIQTDRKAGEDGDAVRVVLTAQARGYAYNEGDLREAVAQAVVNWVRTNITTAVRPNFDVSNVQSSVPQVLNIQEGKVTLGAQADAYVAFSLTDDLARNIRDLVKGKDISQASSLITQTYGRYVLPASIQSKVLWFNISKLPGDPSHIQVQSSTPAQSTPGGQPTQP